MTRRLYTVVSSQVGDLAHEAPNAADIIEHLRARPVLAAAVSYELGRVDRICDLLTNTGHCSLLLHHEGPCVPPPRVVG